VAGRRPGGAALFWIAEFGVLVAFAVIALALTEVQSALPPLLANDPWAFYNGVALLVSATLLGGLWIKAPNDEIRILDQLGAEYFPAPPGWASGLVYLSILVFLCLMLSSIIPAAFSGVLLVLKALEALNARVGTTHIRDGIQRILGTKTLPESQEAQGVTLDSWHNQALVVSDYYFERPWRVLAALETALVGLAGIGLAFLVNVSDATVRTLGSALGTAMIVVALAANELVATRWRWARDAGLVRSEKERLTAMPRVTVEDFRRRRSSEDARDGP
jgi:hypothetical protein